LAASGQAKLTGRLAVCAGTTGPGSTRLVAGLYEGARDHAPAPVLALSGNMPRKMQGVDYIQTTNPDLLFRDVSLYTETINSPEQAPAVINRRSPRPTRAAASLISHCRKTSSWREPTAASPAWTLCGRARRSRRARRM
jgi:glyoxylate carboligase